MSTHSLVNVGDLQTAIHLLQALRDPTRPDHTSALHSLETNVFQPSFVVHILHIFSSGGGYDASFAITPDIRQLAGLIIKNYVFPYFMQFPADLQHLVKTELLHILHDPISDLRKTAAILLGKISESFMLDFWIDLLPHILDHLSTENYTQRPASFDGCLHAIHRICEDSSVKLSMEGKVRPLDVMIPKFLNLLTCINDSAVRVRVLESYNCLLYLLEGPNSIQVGGLRSRNTSYDSNVDTNSVSSNSAKNKEALNSSAANASSPIFLNMPQFIETLARLSSDGHAPLRKCVCQSITIIACLQISVLEAYFSNICEFMLTSLMDSQEEVAMESCEFWNALLQSPDTKRAILPYLKRLIEHLITRLYLTPDQMESERIEEEEEESGEKALNIQPLFHRTRTTSSGNGNEMKENNELSAKWTLRKQAALTLDVIAMSFPPREILGAALPKVQSCFEDANVLVKESGMLALGALSSGCLEDMAMYIPQLFPFIIANLKNDLPEMRSIACWVLSRYSKLFGDRTVSNTFSAEAGQQFYNTSLQELVNTMFDRKPKVQVAACSALCLLIENSFLIPISPTPDAAAQQAEQNILIPSLQTLLTAINRAFDVYGVKAGLILIDLIGAIADTLGAAISSFTALYFPKLVHKFFSLDDFDTRLFPILECLTSVLAVIGLEAKDFLGPIYQRCLRILAAVFSSVYSTGTPSSPHNPSVAAHSVALTSALSSASNGRHDDGVNKDFAVCAMDVISAISEGIHMHFIHLITPTASDVASSLYSIDLLLEVMFLGLRDSDLPELRQSSFSLAGELCKHSFPVLANAPGIPQATPSPHLHQPVNQQVSAVQELLTLATNNLDSNYPLVCNNAAWTIGELSIHLPPQHLLPLLDDMMNGLVFALQTSDLADHLKVNIAVTIGRLAIKCPIEVAELADEFFAAWCSVLPSPCPPMEKCQAFYGLLAVLHHNPDVIIGNKTNIYSLLIAAVSWEYLPPPDIIDGLSAIFHHLSQQDNGLWNKVLKTFSNSYSIDYFRQLYRV
mmetsp:Transcript_19376/g.20998  ORF Transcript_19376/g.20998 Transcript_19376/m.20998 type:complete len:1025 (+) Transcript_19376:149-3223(+)|eukprot:CAMPEP_0173149490 /NCGR_PEP_ID=MMETSP1105-20130129/10356_1 /TAXON_ID=2985 /ORGANISM="Ochromonas sp., Strain BG-1" /LENGTH=1024 /DNA_ID=CAMNT_0014064365 /DNA_START=209 /DNA_END=3283 /DNA_ORIENTATION=-